jgi:hypothetical protein
MIISLFGQLGLWADKTYRGAGYRNIQSRTPVLEVSQEVSQLPIIDMLLPNLGDLNLDEGVVCLLTLMRYPIFT